MIALHGSYYGDNFGDLLLLKIFESWTESTTSSGVVYPMVPKSERDRFKSHFPNASVGLDQQRSWQALIYVGGGHFGEPDSDVDRWSKRFFRRHVLPAELCIWRNVPYAILGVGAGPLSNRFVRYEVKRIFSHAAVSSVRDIESKQFIQDSLDIISNGVVAPDAALTINKADIPVKALEIVDRLLEAYRGTILLGIHHPPRFLAKTPQSELMRSGLLSSLASASDVTPVVFSDTGGHNLPSDNLAKLIQNSTGKECLSLPFLGIWETVALISKLSAILTTKLHVGIVAYALGTYCESFATHSKTPRFYRQIGRASQCIMLKDVNKDVVVEKIDRAIQIARSKVSIMDKDWQKIKDDASLHQKLVSSFLNSVSSV